MLMNTLLIFFMWGPHAIRNWLDTGVFPYLAIGLAVTMGYGIWSVTENDATTFGLALMAGSYGLYVVMGGFFWFTLQGNPEVTHNNWIKEFFGL